MCLSQYVLLCPILLFPIENKSKKKSLKKMKCWLRLLLLSRFLPLLRGQLKHICYNFTALYLLTIILNIIIAIIIIIIIITV